ncbi:MAG: hypothetical protein B6A08_07060 [Sorangiineae bacterium NIC37A_2]|nr:MAG: hypothetical protein B6A08_07060 [Sorangiineae bacterium NIC37A_2]
MAEHTLSLEADWSSYFRDVIEDTAKGSARPPDPVMSEYVLGLLTETALPGSPIEQTVGAPLALQLAEALQAARAVRFERLRKLGDGVLLLGGLYQPHLARSGLDDGYVVRIGQRAYGLAASLMPGPTALSLESPSPQADVLAELASSFTELMLFLRNVADTMAIRAMRTSKDMVLLLERWLESRSDYLGRLLKAEGVPIGALA